MITHILFDRVLLVFAPNNRVTNVVLSDLGLQVPVLGSGDAAAENGAELVWMTDAAIEVE